MKDLGANWRTRGLIDFEYKKYILKAYLKSLSDLVMYILKDYLKSLSDLVRKDGILSKLISYVY